MAEERLSRERKPRGRTPISDAIGPPPEEAERGEADGASPSDG